MAACGSFCPNQLVWLKYLIGLLGTTKLTLDQIKNIIRCLNSRGWLQNTNPASWNDNYEKVWNIVTDNLQPDDIQAAWKDLRDIAVIDRIGKVWPSHLKKVSDALEGLRHEERRAALMALTVDFHLPEHWETARQFLEHDPDDFCRITATTAFSALMADTHDRPTLQLLAHVVRNEQEDTVVRTSAYGAMLSVLGAPKREQFSRRRRASTSLRMLNGSWSMSIWLSDRCKFLRRHENVAWLCLTLIPLK